MTDTTRPLTPTQVATFDDLLQIGAERPTMPVGLIDELRTKITDGVSDAAHRWTDRRLWIGKSQLSVVARCEGQLVADADKGRPSTMHPATAVGIVSHRAIQISHTHPGQTPAAYVSAAMTGALSESGFAAFWETADMGTQSDLTTQMVSKVVSFMDSWPPLSDRWVPRFEESVQAQLGGIVLGCRADLVLGRPRPDGVQTMVLCDLKSGALSDHHYDEASFYALVAALRHGIAPYRSCVYSLASGTWTDPDVTAERLHDVADKVIVAANTIVEVLGDGREPTLTAGRWCSWCPARDTCPANAAAA